MPDMKEVLSKEQMDLFYDYSLNNVVEKAGNGFIWCMTPDCKNAIQWEENKEQTEFKCGKCQKAYCLKCRVPWHDKQTCEEFKLSNTEDENDVKFKELVQGANFKQCPHCKFWVEKTMGCNHMRCKCGNDFCYLCGGLYPNCAC